MSPKITKKQISYATLLAERNIEAATPVIAAAVGRDPEKIALKKRGINTYICGELSVAQGSELIDQLQAL